jgi:hypothetical protein
VNNDTKPGMGLEAIRSTESHAQPMVISKANGVKDIRYFAMKPA